MFGLALPVHSMILCIRLMNWRANKAAESAELTVSIPERD